MKVSLKQAVKLFYSQSSFDQIYLEAVANALDASARNITISFEANSLTDVNSFKLSISVDGRNWLVYKNVQGFKTLYLAQVGEGVVRIGSNVEDPNNVDIIEVITGVKAK